MRRHINVIMNDLMHVQRHREVAAEHYKSRDMLFSYVHVCTCRIYAFVSKLRLCYFYDVIHDKALT